MVQLGPHSGFALGIMVSILILIGIGGRSFDVVQQIDQSPQLALGVLPGTRLGVTEDVVQLGPQSWFALVGLAGTTFGITEDVVQLGPHPGLALEMRESRDSTR